MNEAITNNANFVISIDIFLHFLIHCVHRQRRAQWSISMLYNYEEKSMLYGFVWANVVGRLLIRAKLYYYHMI